jgi:hypothetical protein
MRDWDRRRLLANRALSRQLAYFLKLLLETKCLFGSFLAIHANSANKFCIKQMGAVRQK